MAVAAPLPLPVSPLDRAGLDGLLARLTLAGPRDGLPILAPATGQEVGRVPRGTGEDVALAAARARAAQRAWGQVPVRERARLLLRFHDLVLDRQDELLDLIQLESGKVRAHAYEEVVDVALVARYYAIHGPRHLRPRRRRGGLPLFMHVTERRVPVGVVGIISPWNYPLTLAVSDALPALLAGNAVIARPDPQTTLTALRAAQLLDEAGLPPDLFHVVSGAGPELGSPLIAQVDHVAFTGSTATGRIVARQAAERLIGCSLELGGKNPMIVLEDADVEAASEAAIRGFFSSAGQLCISMERLYVHAAIHDRFVARLLERTRAMRMGVGPDWELEMGPLLSAAQLERVEAQVRDAVARGATVLAGGRARPDLAPWFYEPTILAGVTPAMRVFGEETFGPVVSLYRVGSEDEAVAAANASAYGLNASVWTRDHARGRRLAARLRCGTVNVNEIYGTAWSSTDAPIGGMGDSGLGRRHGAEGILCYTEAQVVAVQRGLRLRPPFGMSQRGFARAVTGLLRLARWVPGLR